MFLDRVSFFATFRAQAEEGTAVIFCLSVDGCITEVCFAAQAFLVTFSFCPGQGVLDA